MKLKKYDFLSIAISSFVFSAMPAYAQNPANPCSKVANSDHTTTFLPSGIQRVNGIITGSWKKSILLNYDRFAIADHKFDWRLPSKADMEIIGTCLPKGQAYWTTAKVEGSNRVYAYLDGKFYDENPDEEKAVVGISIRGPSPSDRAAFRELGKTMREAEDKFEQERPRTPAELKQDAQLAGLMELLKEREKASKIAAKEAEARDAVHKAKQTAVLSKSEKGSILNCMSSSVVPVSTSINEISFLCPNIGRVDVTALQKYKWKITSTERINAQATDYRTDAYGLRNWNGNGVVISLMVEKQ